MLYSIQIKNNLYNIKISKKIKCAQPIDNNENVQNICLYILIVISNILYIIGFTKIHR